MDSMEVNKAIAAVLVAGIAFFVTGTIADNLISEQRLEKPVLKIEGAPAEATTGAPKKEELPPLAPLLAKADVKVGQAFAEKVCTACHTFNQGGKAEVGPNLYGVVGGPHAHMEGFNYSNALKEKKGPWTYEELNEWLHKPSSYAPGTRMSFAGISNAQQRADVIAFLKSISPSAPPFPSPEAAKPEAAKPAAAAAPAGNAAQSPAASASSATGAGAPGAGKPAAGGSAAAPSAPQPAPAKQ